MYSSKREAGRRVSLAIEVRVTAELTQGLSGAQCILRASSQGAGRATGGGNAAVGGGKEARRGRQREEKRSSCSRHCSMEEGVQRSSRMLSLQGPQSQRRQRQASRNHQGEMQGKKLGRLLFVCSSSLQHRFFVSSLLARRVRRSGPRQGLVIRGSSAAAAMSAISTLQATHPWPRRRKKVRASRPSFCDNPLFCCSASPSLSPFYKQSGRRLDRYSLKANTLRFSTFLTRMKRWEKEKKKADERFLLLLLSSCAPLLLPAPLAPQPALFFPYQYINQARLQALSCRNNLRVK